MKPWERASHLDSCGTLSAFKRLGWSGPGDFLLPMMALVTIIDALSLLRAIAAKISN